MQEGYLHLTCHVEFFLLSVALLCCSVALTRLRKRTTHWWLYSLRRGRGNDWIEVMSQSHAQGVL